MFSFLFIKSVRMVGGRCMVGDFMFIMYCRYRYLRHCRKSISVLTDLDAATALDRKWYLISAGDAKVILSVILMEENDDCLLSLSSAFLKEIFYTNRPPFFLILY